MKTGDRVWVAIPWDEDDPNSWKPLSGTVVEVDSRRVRVVLDVPAEHLSSGCDYYHPSRVFATEGEVWELFQLQAVMQAVEHRRKQLEWEELADRFKGKATGEG